MEIDGQYEKDGSLNGVVAFIPINSTVKQKSFHDLLLNIIKYNEEIIKEKDCFENLFKEEELSIKR